MPRNPACVPEIPPADEVARGYEGRQAEDAATSAAREATTVRHEESANCTVITHHFLGVRLHAYAPIRQLLVVVQCCTCTEKAPDAAFGR